MNHIFISYSRKDLDAARRIVEGLGREGLEIWFDWDSIPKGEDWEKEIYRGIEEAEAFLFLVSPDSIRSEMCNREILHAIRNKKRILPILLRTTEIEHFHKAEAQAEIHRLNWVWCREGQDDFHAAIKSMVEAIRTDYEWVRFHTLLQVKSLAWEQAHRDGSRLLRGRELKSAVDRIEKAPSTIEPPLTETQRRFLAESRGANFRRRMGPFAAILTLSLTIFIGGRFYYLLLPVQSACPAVTEVNMEISKDNMPEDFQNRLFPSPGSEAVKSGRSECTAGAKGTIKVEVHPIPGTKEVQIAISLPAIPAYGLDFLPEVRTFGPETMREDQAEAMLKASAAYAVGDYQAAIVLLRNFDGISISILRAQALLYLDKSVESRDAYEHALIYTAEDEETRGRLLAGLALTWWRPELYYQLSGAEASQACSKAGGYYAGGNAWLETSPLAQNIRIAFAQHCAPALNSTDPSLDTYMGWGGSPPVMETDPMATEFEMTRAIGHFILAIRIGSDAPDSRAMFVSNLTQAESLLAARALLSEYYSAVEEDCRTARVWRERFRSGILSDLEKRKLQRLLQAEPYFCP